jgi:putative inorganic carbon (hco3(-)) transporter
VRMLMMLHQPSRRAIVILLLLLALLGSGAALHAGTPQAGQWKMMIAALLAVAPGIFIENKKEYFLLLLIFVKTFSTLSIKIGIPSAFDTGALYTLDISDLLVAGLYFAWFLESRKQRAHCSASLEDYHWCLAGLWILCLLSVIGSAGQPHAIHEAAKVLKGILVFLYVAKKTEDFSTIRRILIVLMISLAFQASLAIIQPFFPRSLGILSVQGDATRVLPTFGIAYRACGTYGSGNMLSCLYLDFLLPITISMFLIGRESRWTKVAMGILYAMGTLSLVFTLSRGGWIAFALGLFLYSIGLRVVRTRIKPFSSKSILVIGLVFVILYGTRNIILSRSVMSDGGWSTTFRVYLMQVAFSMIKSHPWLGVGIGGYTAVMHLYDRTIINVTKDFPYPVHNLYLYIAAECGLPSLVCFLAFTVSTLRRAWSILHSADRTVSVIALGLTCGLVASLFHGLSEPIFIGDYFLFWLACGLIVALEAVPHELGAS